MKSSADNWPWARHGRGKTFWVAAIKELCIAAVLMYYGIPAQGEISAIEGVSEAQCAPAEAADGAGADRFGYRWRWHRESSEVEILDHGGELLQAIEVPPARAVDAETGWGVVVLDAYGRSAALIRASAEVASWRLDHEAVDVAWIGPERVALATALAAHAIEILDLATGKVVDSFAPDGEIRPTPGATFLRARKLYLLGHSVHRHVRL